MPNLTELSKLCASCGLCCNGVLFFGAKLQPGDNERALSAKGLKIKRVDGERQALQPCPALTNSGCAIYEDRPIRCRRFECRQFQEVASGRRTMKTAQHTVETALKLVAEVHARLEDAGDARKNKPFSVRCAGLFAEPVDPSIEAVRLRDRAQESLNRLEAFLQKEFRDGTGN